APRTAPRRPPVMLLLPSLLPGDRSRIPDPQLMSTTRQQTLKPMRVPAGFDPHQHRPAQSLVELPGFFGMEQPALDQLARLFVQHCYHLKARMKVTTDILHMRSPSSRAFGQKQIEFTRDCWGPLSSYNQGPYASKRSLQLASPGPQRAFVARWGGSRPEGLVVRST